MGYKVQEMSESRFLKKEDVGVGVLVTIKEITREDIALEGKPEDLQYLMHFEELDKPMVLKPTNAQACQMACGGAEDTDDWVGHKIVLYNDPNVSFAGKITGGIRLRKPKQAVQQAIRESKAILNKSKLDVANAALNELEEPDF
jgi:hypothetical protein